MINERKIENRKQLEFTVLNSDTTVQAFYSKNTYILLNTTHLNNEVCLDSGLGLVTTVYNYLC